MKLIKPKFWEKKDSLISIVLIPIAIILQIVMKLKNLIIHSKTFKIPVVCVGNIYIGGTGKTPLCILIAKEIIKNKKKPAIIKKFYLSHKDEHLLIQNNIECLYLNKSRASALVEAEKDSCEIAVLDDGFQDKSIKKDLNVICFNSRQSAGNERTFPAGPLRESLDSLKKADIVLINGEKNISFEKKILNISSKIEIFYSNYLPLNLKNYTSKNYLAFSGIGNPNNFFDLLLENGVNLKKKLVFPDHYQFKKNEIEQIIFEAEKKNLDIITTEKDYMRIKNFNFKEIKYLKLELNIENKEKFLKKIFHHL